jgi:hypothetical protein
MDDPHAYDSKDADKEFTIVKPADLYICVSRGKASG